MAGIELEIERLANQLALSEFFFNLDGDFHDLQKVYDDTYSYNGTGVQVINTWELPIVIQWPNSTIRFKFSTTPGDIHFGIAFVPALEDGQNKDDMKVEMVEDVALVTSSTSDIEGEFSLNSEGVIIMMWDNNYDWTAIKKLSYVVEVYEPSFYTIDFERADHSFQILDDVVEELKMLEGRFTETEEFIRENSVELPIREDEVIDLQSTLDRKIAEFAELEKEIRSLSAVVEVNTRRIGGLGIRCLSKFLLSKVFEYLNIQGGVTLVCKYWQSTASDMRQRIVTEDCLFLDVDRIIYPLWQRREVVRMLKDHTYGEYLARISFNVSSSPSSTPLLSATQPDDVDESEHYDILSELKPVITSSSISSSQQIPVRQPASTVSFTLPPTPSSSSAANHMELTPKTPKLNRGPEPSESVLTANLAKAEVDTRIASMIMTIHSHSVKLSILESEKRKVKRALKIWNINFEKEHNRPPTNFERKEFVGKLYEDYQKISLTLRVRQDKVDDMLRRISLSREEFEDIRRNPDSSWQGLHKRAV